MTDLEQMWVELAKWQPEADKRGYGATWAEMCELKTAAACWAVMFTTTVAAYARYAAEAAASAAWAAAKDATNVASVNYWAQKAIDHINKALELNKEKQND